MAILTPLARFHGIGANSSFILKKQGQIHKVQKVGEKSSFHFKTGVRMPKPQPLL